MAQNDSNKGTQLALFDPSTVDTAISKVFSKTPIKKDGKELEGQFVFKPDAPKELKERLQLKGKGNADKLEAAILEAGDGALRVVKMKVAGLGPESTLRRYTEKVVGGYEEQHIVIRTVPRKVTASTLGDIEAENAAMMGISVEEYRAKVAEYRKKKAASTVDVTSTIVPPAALPAPPVTTPEAGQTEQPKEMTQEEKDAAELARMESDEAQKQAAADAAGK